MDWWQLYLLAVMPNVGVMALSLGLSMTGIAAACVAYAGDCNSTIRLERQHPDAGSKALIEESTTRRRLAMRVLRIAACIALPLIVLAALIPSERGLMLMLGGYVVTNTDGVENLPENFVGAANAFLERYAESGDEK